MNWAKDVPSVVGSHINVLELLTAKIAVERWGHLWSGLHIKVRSDNQATVAAINKATSRSSELLAIVSDLFWMSTKFDFRLSASFIPGVENILSDRVSRMTSLKEACEASWLLSGFSGRVMECKGHTSFVSFLYLQERWEESMDC